MSASVATRRPVTGGALEGTRTNAPARGGRGLLLLAVFAIAFGARLWILVRTAGIDGLGAYDDGVYYAAADALVHGRLPYRDFLLIHPPLIAIVTAPFAAIGSVTTDLAGFVAARLAFIALGAGNAVLCAVALRRFGTSAAVVGGLAYALADPAAFAERSVLLEPLGTAGVLAALVLLQRADRDPRIVALAGAAAAAATCTKIWYVVPALLLIVAARSRWRAYLLGLAAGGTAICLPFFLAAPGAMVQEVLLDQLGRKDATSTIDPGTRVATLLGAQPVANVPVEIVTAVLGAAVLVAVLVALRSTEARIFGLLAVATCSVLLLAPSWYAHYAGYSAPALVLCVGFAAGRLLDRLGAQAAPAVAATLVLAALTPAAVGGPVPSGIALPAGIGDAASEVQGCVTADDPGALIAMDVLSRDLQDPTCEVRPDVTGWAYQPGEVARGADGVDEPLESDERWQRDVLAFLESGDATITIRPDTGLDTVSQAVIDDGQVLFARGDLVVHATTRHPKG